MINLLILTNELNFTDGVTSHLFNLLNQLKKEYSLNFILVCSGGDSVKRFENSGIKVYVEKNLNHANRSLVNYSKIVLSILKITRLNKTDIIHSHNHYAANIAGIVSKYISLKKIQTIHGIFPEGGRLEHFKADKFIAVSEPVNNYLIKNKIAKEYNIKLIRHGFPEIKNLQTKNRDEIKIICASRLVYEKGADVFINASKIVKNKFKGNVRFFVAGKGEEEADLKSLSKKLNTEINFCGNVKDIPGLLLETNFFVMPTRSLSEGFPMSIVEAAFAKNLIITSQFDWLDNVFVSGTDGLAFETGNFYDLADKILFALENPDAADKMCDNFHFKALKLFNLKTFADNHLELYEECLRQ